LAGDVALDAAYDPAVRARLAAEARIHPPDVLAAWLAALAPERAAQIAPNDPYRVARALEVVLASRPSTEPALSRVEGLREAGIPFVKLVLETEPGVLAERIERRVDGMLSAGLLEEAERVGSEAVAADAVGYREALAFLAGFSTGPELRAQLIRSTRRYAKRQATWLRSEPGVVRVSAAECEAVARERLGWA
jgi:tRNA dimethylallyltransferase